MTTQRKDRMDTLGASILIGNAVVLGLNQAMVKLVNEGFAPVFQAGLRSVAAFLPVLLFAWLMKRRLGMRDGSLPWGILNGVFFCLEFALLFLALDYTTVARASLFFYVMPVWVAIGAHFMVPGERLNRSKVIGLTLALGGLALALGADLGPGGESAWLGDLLALLAGVFWAGIALLTRIKLSHVTPEMNLLYQLAVSGVVLTLLAVLTGDTFRDPTPLIWAVFTGQVVFVVCISFLLWFWVLSIYPVSNMASFGLLAPLFAILFGWWIYDDPLTPAFLIAILAAGSGIVFVNRVNTEP